MGEYKIKTYSKNDIDYFVGVDLEDESLYIIPISISSQYSSSIGISMCSTYKNNFNLKEPISGNINSGEDDNVEALTGNDVGTE